MITATQLRKSSIDTYVYKDKGINHFEDFEHLHSVKCFLNGNDHSGQGFIWAICDGIGSVSPLYISNGICLYVSWTTGGNLQFIIRNIINDAWGDYDTWMGVENKTYWLTTERDGTTLTCKIYNDRDRTDLAYMLELTVETTKFRYIYAVSNQDAGAIADINLYIYDFDLQEGVVAGTDFMKPIKYWGA